MLTDAGWSAANEWGISAVVDLRCEYEIGYREGDPVVDPSSFASILVTNAPTEDQDDPKFRDVCLPILDSPEYWRHNWRILPGFVLESLRAIASSPSGVLVHCSAGRDRTGMISTLLLSNAGVAPDDVAADYAESVRAMAGVVTHAPTGDRQAAWARPQVEAWILETAPIVRDVAADPDAAFDAIGADQELRARLRGKLTE
jgi:hypothetical protein